MSRHTAFRYCLDLTVEQSDVLARHAGAARFAFNQSLHFVKSALDHRKTHPDHPVPWTRFDLINAFNTWKKSEDAGRVFAVDTDGVTEVRVTGLAWRSQVCQQVFEEAAVDCGRALTSFSASRTGKRAGKRVGFPRFKQKGRSNPSFRIRNKHSKGGWAAIRVGDNEIARSVAVADRWYPSSKRCSACATIKPTLALADRVFACECGFRADRDHNAAVNLAVWPTIHQDFSRSPDPRAGGRVTKVRRREGADRYLIGVGVTVPVDAETDVRAAFVA
ncbi:zinc ribbon domain-containing protein [Nocardia sp. NPDC058658]|uniref:zinc ribbon domain-containing protein n=1 Tax=Nocardia sp. NPDC058658 TaxID=3346580 RepID=UPI00364FF022